MSSHIYSACEWLGLEFKVIMPDIKVICPTAPFRCLSFAADSESPMWLFFFFCTVHLLFILSNHHLFNSLNSPLSHIIRSHLGSIIVCIHQDLPPLQTELMSALDSSCWLSGSGHCLGSEALVECENWRAGFKWEAFPGDPWSSIISATPAASRHF